MSATPDSTLADPQQIIADLRRTNGELQRRLDEALAERDEALEQQTATAEVLQVINSSPGALTPVFDAILEKARLACGAPHGDLWTRDGDVIQLAATHGDPRFAEWLWQHPRVPLWKGSPPERVVLGEEYVQ